MTETAMKILIQREDFTLVETRGVKTFVLPGVYVRTHKGYWYHFSPDWGQLTRCKLKREYGRLETMLTNAMDTPDASCGICGKPIHVNPDGDWVHTSSAVRHEAYPPGRRT